MVALACRHDSRSAAACRVPGRQNFLPRGTLGGLQPRAAAPLGGAITSSGDSASHRRKSQRSLSFDDPTIIADPFTGSATSSGVALGPARRFLSGLCPIPPWRRARSIVLAISSVGLLGAFLLAAVTLTTGVGLLRKHSSRFHCYAIPQRPLSWSCVGAQVRPELCPTCGVPCG
jgi:hypothetical protein